MREMLALNRELLHQSSFYQSSFNHPYTNLPSILENIHTIYDDTMQGGHGLHSTSGAVHIVNVSMPD